jgi:NADPH:quinone reductase-like Zn-dependent oxidoreductase
MGYDAPGTMGVLSKTSKMPGHSVIPIPKNTKYSLEQWAAFSLRYVTAWANWKVALSCWKSQMSAADVSQEWVLAWGGGVSLAQSILAKNEGFNVIMVSSGDERLEQIRNHGIKAIDRRELTDLQYDPVKYNSEKEYKRRYMQAERLFAEKVHEATSGKDISILIDYIGLPVYRASLKVLARQGVITTAGWKEGMVLTNYRAIECITRHIHVHTHYANYQEGKEAVAYAEKNGWLPDILPSEIYHFTDIPRLKEDYDNNILSYFPIFRINGV